MLEQLKLGLDHNHSLVIITIVNQQSSSFSLVHLYSRKLYRMANSVKVDVAQKANLHHGSVYTYPNQRQIYSIEVCIYGNQETVNEDTPIELLEI